MRLLSLKVGVVVGLLFQGEAYAAPSDPLLFLGFSKSQPLRSFTGQLYKDTGVALDSQIYKVRAGDTLYSIANRFGTEYEIIAELNGIANPSNLSVGQTLLISSWDYTDGQGTQLQLLLQHLQKYPEKRIKHLEVDSNDNLYRISQIYRETMKSLRDENKLDHKFTIYPGDVLQLSMTEYWGPHLANLPWKDDHFFYLAKEGQSVLEVAQQLGVNEIDIKVIAPRVLWVDNLQLEAKPVVKGIKEKNPQAVKQYIDNEAAKADNVVGVRVDVQKAGANTNLKSREAIAAQIVTQKNKNSTVQMNELAPQAISKKSLELVKPSGKPKSQEVSSLLSVESDYSELADQPAAERESSDEFSIAADPVINGLTFSPTRQLDEDDLLEAKSLVIGESLELASLQPALDYLNMRYQSKDFKLSQAIVSQQQVVNGVIHIELVEAKVGQVFLADSAGLKEEFVTQQIAIESGDDVNVGELDARLQRYNRYHSAKARVALQAGEQFGESDIAVSMVAPRNITSSISLTNQGSHATGKEQHVWNLDIWNLSGLDDQLSLNTQHSQGVNSTTFVYNRHVGVEGASLSVSGSVSSSNVISGPLSELGVSGAGRSSAFEFAYPLHMGERLFIDGTLGYSRQYSETSYSGGATSQNSFSQKYSLGYKLEYSGKDTVWTYVPKYQIYMLDNLDALGTTTEHTGHKVMSDFQLKHMLSSDVSFGLSNSLQYSLEKDINSIEQFSIGGLGSVRAYGASSHAGDSGVYFGAQIESSIGSMLDLTPGNILNGVQMYAFYDWAVARPFRGEGEKLISQDFFSGYGLGVTMPATDAGFSFDFFVGQPENTDTHSDVIESDKPLVLGQMKVAF